MSERLLMIGVVQPNPLRASVGSTDAPRRDLRGSMRFCTLVTIDS